MKKLLLLLITLPLFSLAQDHRGHAPRALLSMNESGSEVLLGTITGGNTSQELVLRNPRLIAQQENCLVSGFSFSMKSGNKSYGPVSVNGSTLTDEIKDKIRDWDANNVTITLDNIHLKCSGQETTAHPVTVHYDH